MSAAAASPTIFRAFNARVLEPHEVARTFVPSSQFDKLTKRCHTVVVGPRGSGKTTLLKMLQQPALEAWKHPAGQECRNRVDYTGIFIPSDINWKNQLESLGRGSFSEEHTRLLGGAAFTTHVLQAVVTAMRYRVHSEQPAEFPQRRVSLSEKVETNLVRDVARAWCLDPIIPSLFALKHALSARLTSIGALASQEATLGENDRAERLGKIEYLHLPYLQAAAQAIEVFDDAICETGAKWALLFDELELAPVWIRQNLRSALRSVNPLFLFKLAISPYDHEMLATNMLSPMPDDDYEAIPLWYAHKEEGIEFCKSLWKSMVESRGLVGDSAYDILGTSLLDTEATEWKELGTAYRSGSAHQRRFSVLAGKDASFRSYLRERHINVRRLEMVAGDARAADIRKITALVAVREAFLTYKSDPFGKRKPAIRSRKNTGLYSGTGAFFAMVEGNPRWLIGIGNRLLDAADLNKPIDARLQNREITRAAGRFRAMLKTIPCEPIKGRQPARGVLSLLDSIGEFFGAAIVLEPFNPDPPVSFTVGSRSNSVVFDTIGKALNTGALVYVPDMPADVLLSDNLRGKRFRLSYLLAENYYLPLILGRSVSLDQILKGRPPNGDSEETPLLPSFAE